MQTTTNYGFNIVEGTDIVNPLTQENPNWNSTDTILKAISDCTFNLATHYKSGNTHLITRDVSTPGYNIIRFRATADWNEGDILSLDGVTQTVCFSNGETPGEGAFKTDNYVLLFKFGTRTRVTMFASPTKYLPTASEVTTTGGDSVQDYIDGTKFKNLETWTPNIGENWETFLARIRDNSTKTIPANFIRCTCDGISGLIFRQSRRTSATSWQYETDYFTGNSLVKYVLSTGADSAVVRKYDILNGTIQNLSSADAQTINIYGLDV